MNITINKHLLPEFQAIKDDDERFIWLGKPQLNSFIANKLVKGIIGLVLIVAVFAFNHYVTIEDGGSLTFVYAILALIFVPTAIKYLFNAFSYQNIVYGFSDKRVMMRGGLIGTDFKMIDYDKIIDIEVSLNPVDRLFDTGTIKIHSGRNEVDDEGNKTKLFDDWLHVEKPYELIKSIKKVMVDVKTDYSYPNAKRPPVNPGYSTKYEPS